LLNHVEVDIVEPVELWMSNTSNKSIGFAFITSEKGDNFTWVLEMCKDPMLKVIVTDMNTTLMNVIAKVFQNLAALVYWYHISKNVRDKSKTLCNSKELRIDTVMESLFEESYVDGVVEFGKVCEKFPKFVK
jgi:hypothetical protein